MHRILNWCCDYSWIATAPLMALVTFNSIAFSFVSLFLDLYLQNNRKNSIFEFLFWPWANQYVKHQKYNSFYHYSHFGVWMEMSIHVCIKLFTNPDLRKTFETIIIYLSKYPSLMHRDKRHLLKIWADSQIRQSEKLYKSNST